MAILVFSAQLAGMALPCYHQPFKFQVFRSPKRWNHNFDFAIEFTKQTVWAGSLFDAQCTCVDQEEKWTWSSIAKGQWPITLWNSVIQFRMDQGLVVKIRCPMTHEVLIARRQSIFYFFAYPGRGGPQKASASWCWLPGMLRPASAWICKKN